MIQEADRRFLVWTIGCQMNEADSSRIAAMLHEAGYRETDSEDNADVIVLNSCVVRQSAEDRVAGKLNQLMRLKRERPGLSLMLTGCMVTNQESALRQRFPHVDHFFEPSDFAALARAVPELQALEDDLETLPHYYADSASDPRVSAFVPIIYGCNFLCSYCIVPYRRGKERSRTLTEIVSEVDGLVRRGVREVTLLGQTVNAYGHDLEPQSDLAALLEAVGEIPGLDRLRFLTSHPKYMSDSILDTMADCDPVCEHLNLPVQAGDNDVLKRMRRTYTTDLWLDRLAYARSRMPELTVATDIIVGFPGETDAQFMNTLQLLETAACDKVHVAMYSPRPGTLSARWEDDIPHEEKQRRHQAVETLQERVAAKRNADRLGSKLEILVDSKAKGRWTGRSRGNTLVHFDNEADLLGKLVEVEVTRTTPWYLIGDAASAPR